MATRSLRWKGFGLTAEIPESVSRRLRRVVNRFTAPPPDGVTGPLIVEDPPPTATRKRDPNHAVAFIRERLEHRALAEAGANGSSDPLLRKVETHPWYHTIELPNGLVTPGSYDHRPLVESYGIPDDLHGKRVLDVGSFDGFWAFEFERRGATVTALDIETTDQIDLPAPVLEFKKAQGLASDPLREGFFTARELLHSNVTASSTSVYDLDPAALGRFDLVHAGDLLLHLRDPVRALERIRSVTEGDALLSDVFDPTLDRLGQGPGLVRHEGGWEIMTWRIPALTTLVQMVADAGFSDVSVVTTYNLPHRGRPSGPWRAVIRAHV